jgi:hypothetical protein
MRSGSDMLNRLSFILSSALLVLLLASGAQNDDGRAGRTGSPGETTCVNSCHNTFALNSGTGSVVLTAANMPNWEYEPGITYQVTATVSLTGSVLFGIGLECLTSAGSNAGSLSITDPASTQLLNVTVGGNSRRNLVHTLGGGSGTGSKAFTFNWTAPSTNIGDVTFYFAGNASNNNGMGSGDRIYSGSQLVTPSLTTGVGEAVSTSPLAVFPNPSTGRFQVELGGQEVPYRILDLGGRSVQQGVFNATLNTIDLSSEQEGVYLLQLLGEGEVRTTRLVKN